MSKKKLVFIVISGMISGAVLCSCSKGGQESIVSAMTGKWKSVQLVEANENTKVEANGNVEIPTNDRVIYTYESATSSYKSSSSNSDGNFWMNKLRCKCKFEGKLITEINIASSPTNIFETTVGSVESQTMSATVKHTRGTKVSSEKKMTFCKVTKDYKLDVIGLWEGIELTGPQTYGDEKFRLEFLADGTYKYYFPTGAAGTGTGGIGTGGTDAGGWTPSADKVSEYIIDGDWLALHWKDSSDADYYECWDIQSCEDSVMVWTARRKDAAGKVATATVTVKRVDDKPLAKDTYTMASFNIRYDNSGDTGDKDWSTCRKNLVAKLVSDRDFDVCGFVEVTQPGMRNDLNSLLGSKYSFKLCGRNNGSTSGEAVGFGYKKDRFNLAKSGYFYLNSHPSTPGEASEWADPQETLGRNRIATWGLLQDKNTSKQILYIVSHFELNKGMRAGSAKLIIQKAKELAPAGVPVFFCGDLNATPSEASCCDTLSNYFKDSYNYAVKMGIEREGEVTTYNGFNSGVSKFMPSKRIDYMYYKGSNVTLLKYGVIYDLVNGKLPSDHYPIYAKVALK